MRTDYFNIRRELLSNLKARFAREDNRPTRPTSPTSPTPAPQTSDSASAARPSFPANPSAFPAGTPSPRKTATTGHGVATANSTRKSCAMPPAKTSPPAAPSNFSPSLSCSRSNSLRCSSSKFSPSCEHPHVTAKDKQTRDRWPAALFPHQPSPPETQPVNPRSRRSPLHHRPASA
jgi:hypothetical protein